MPTQTRSSGRFTRSTATHPSGRFGRSAGRPSRGSTPRLARRPSAGGRARTATTTRTVPSLRRHRPAQRNAPQKAVDALRGVLPGMAVGKGGSKRANAARKPLGLAVVAGLAGLAFSQRDKLASKMRGGHDEHDGVPGDGSYDDVAASPATAPAVPPDAPPSVPPGA
jgi:hypothetical protein